MDTTQKELLFRRAQEAWAGLAQFRASRSRCKRYVFGQQWDDKINVDGRTITEHQYITEQGQIPLKNNLIRRLVRNVLGVYRSNFKLPALKKSDFPDYSGVDVNALNKAVAANALRNSMRELYPRLMEEFLISGIVAVRKSTGILADGMAGVLTHPVTPDNFFFSTAGADPRGWDIDLVGEHHLLPFQALCSRFAKTPADHRRLLAVYSDESCSGHPCRVTETWHRQTETFIAAHDRGKGTLRMLRAEHLDPRHPAWDDRTSRLITREVWIRTFFGPKGETLESSPSSLPWGGHPYVVKCYPFLDGEIHSYVDDVIDQQRFVNRLVTMYDWIMKSSAKGVLLFPQGAIPKGKTIVDVAREWSSFNGVITYRPEPGMPLPQQVSGNAANIGITDLLNIQLQLLEDISGISPTLQGKIENHQTSGSLFEQQSRAAVSSLLDITESFDSFVRASTLADARLLASTNYFVIEMRREARRYPSQKTSTV